MVRRTKYNKIRLIAKLCSRSRKHPYIVSALIFVPRLSLYISHSGTTVCKTIHTAQLFMSHSCLRDTGVVTLSILPTSSL